MPRVTRNAGAAKVITFVNNLTHTSGPFAGQPFNLRPWQRQILAGMYETGANGLRKRRMCLLMLPRKNGKSELAAALCLYHLIGDGEQTAVVISAAADREQAAIVYNIAVRMVRNDPELEAICEVIESQKRIVHRLSGSVYKAISAEAYSKHGGNISFLCYDELHAAANRDLWDVLTTSMGARAQPLTLAISTAGFDRHSILWELYFHAQKVLENPELDPTFLPLLFEAPIEADWLDEKVWRRANPALGDFRSLEDMRIACARAQEIPAQQNTFRRLFLNQWTEQSERWIDMTAWNDCAGAIGWRELREQMRGRPCVAGLDLSSRTDLTALVLVFEDADAGMTLVPWFWCPSEGAAKRERTDRVPYTQWIRDGLITATEGNVVDQGMIRNDINRLAQEYRLSEVAFDPWNATKLSVELGEDGLRVVELRQGFRQLSEPTKHLGALVTGRRLRHGGHPVLRWMASNMVIRQDPNGNLAPDKSKVTERIDGIVAAIMGIAAALVQQHREPSYDLMVFGGKR